MRDFALESLESAARKNNKNKNRRQTLHSAFPGALPGKLVLGSASKRAKGWGGQSGQSRLMQPSTTTTRYWPGQVWERAKRADASAGGRA